MASDAARTEHRRRSIRLRGYDYSQAGAYFITLCAQGRACLFGEITDSEMRINRTGEIVQWVWRAIPEHFSNVTTDEFVIMPNHIHGIVVLTDLVGATHASPLRRRVSGPSRRSVGAVIGSFKSAVTKRINESRGTPGEPVWQRNYYEHIVRSDESLNRIRQYIIDNPANWASDRENPANVGTGGGGGVGARRAVPLPVPERDEP